MIEKSRLRLSAGLIALTLTLGACGGSDKSAPAPTPASATAVTPSGSAAPSTTPAPSSTAPSSATPSSVASSSVAASSTAPGTEGSASSASSEPGSSASPSTQAAGVSGSGQVSAMSGRPAPVTADAAKVPTSQNLGGPAAGVAPKDTPVSVATPKPQIPAQKVAPEDVRPAPVPPVTTPSSSPASRAPGSTAAPSASASKPGAPTSSAAPAPAGPVPHAGADCSVVRCVALTFDDGPSRYTGRLLNILAAEKVPATFYVVGENAAVNPELIARMGAEGHQVGNHSYTHPNLTTLSIAQVRDEMSRTDAAIRAAGVTPSTVRAPYGAQNESTLSAFGGLSRSGSVTWSVDTLDWSHKDPAQTLAAVKAQTRPGGIILMHDLYSTTVDAVPSVIAWLKAQGYTFVTADEITGGVASGRTTGSGMHP